VSLPASLQPLTEPAAGLGLRGHAVAVVDHNPAWATAYKCVESHLQHSLNEFNVEIAHIGSTSVPGLVAKPLLDIAVGVREPFDDQAIIGVLAQAGFRFEADLGIYGGLFFVVRPAANVAVAHLHVVDHNDFQWRWYLAFRDGLRTSDELRAEYSALKRAAAEANATNRAGYNKAKFDWVLATVNALDTVG